MSASAKVNGSVSASAPDGAWYIGGRMNNLRIKGAAVLDKLLQTEAGHEVEFLIWSMEERPPRPVTVTLN